MMALMGLNVYVWPEWLTGSEQVNAIRAGVRALLLIDS
jgi:hypothetical protein